MPDQIDQAQQLTEKATELALAKQQKKTTACSRLFCEECDEPIPEARRKSVAGCTRCVDCQTRAEQKAKGFRL